jgi:hypothetical protein
VYQYLSVIVLIGGVMCFKLTLIMREKKLWVRVVADELSEQQICLGTIGVAK